MGQSLRCGCLWDYSPTLINIMMGAQRGKLKCGVCVCVPLWPELKPPSHQGSLRAWMEERRCHTVSLWFGGYFSLLGSLTSPAIHLRGPKLWLGTSGPRVLCTADSIPGPARTLRFSLPVLYSAASHC